MEKGFIKDYYIWIKHGEIGPHAQGDHVEEVIRERADHDERRVRGESSTEYATTSGPTDGPELVNESEDFDGGLDVEELLMHINNENLVQKKGELWITWMHWRRRQRSFCTRNPSGVIRIARSSR